MNLPLTNPPRHATAQPALRLYARQTQLLALLDALGGVAGTRDFQKLLFLHCQELDVNSPYDFVPYRFGAFSFTSYADRRSLVARGLLTDDDSYWRLTETGRTVAAAFSGDRTVAFAIRYQHLRGQPISRRDIPPIPLLRDQ